jgi:hypothetical protein
MLHRSTLRAGLVVILTAALAPCLPAVAAPSKASVKPPAKKTAKLAPKKVGTASKTPTETVSRLISAMRRRDKNGISDAFNWTRFAAEMNKLIPDGKGLDAATYKTLLVETLNVEPAVSTNLRVGQETKKGADTSAVEMRRLFPSGSGKSGTNQVRTINVLTLGKEKNGLWRIFRLDSAGQPAPTPVAQPTVPRAPQGMVPAAGSDKK